MAEPARATLTPPLTGRLVADRYTIEEELGRGGFGTVYGASADGGERVAVKVFSRREGLAPRADREARTARKLDHPNIHTVLGVENDDDHVYLVSQLVEGERLDRSGLADDQAVRAIAAVCDALAYAHSRGIVHRDVKPANILVARDGTVTLTDFGIASDEDSRDQTVDERVLGTLSYMSPEQAAGTQATGATDVWAAGLTLYTQLTGTNPYKAKTLTQLLEKLAAGAEPLAAVRPDLPKGVCRAIDRALSHDPSRRPDASEMRDRLLRGLAEAEAEPGEAKAKAPLSGRRPIGTRDHGQMALPRFRRAIRPAAALLSALAVAWVLVAFPVYPASWSLPLAALTGFLAYRSPVAAVSFAGLICIPAFWNYAEAAGIVWAGLCGTWIWAGTRWGGTSRLLAPLAAIPLALMGLGPAYVLVAASAPTPRRRAAEAAAGAVVAAVAGGWLPGPAARVLPAASSPMAYATALGRAPTVIAITVAMVIAAVLLPVAWRLDESRRVQAVVLWGIGFGLAVAAAPHLLGERPGAAPGAAVAATLVGILPVAWALAGPRLQRPLTAR
ncbi:MAG: serine/threonine-protein kinase [Gaiellales bacterium]